MLNPYKFILSKTKILFVSLMILAFCFYSNKANAQAPGATCIAAVAIGGTGAVPGCTGAVTMNDFTQEVGSPAMTCLGAGIFRREGWYTFNAPGGQAITVTATATTATSNLLIQVISGTCAAEVQIGCANNIITNSAQTEAVSLGVLGAGTYFIRIVNVGTSVNMAVSNVCVNATPANDDCANASPIVPLGASLGCGGTAGTTAGATQQNTIAPCTAANTTNDDVWYTFTTTSTSHIITVTPSASMNIVFELFSTNPCGGAGTSLNCVNINGVGQTETLSLTGIGIATQYWVRVYDVGTGIPATSTFTICIQTPPPNDNCLNAIVLAPAATCVTTTGNVGVASSSGIAASGTCASSNPDDDVWYTFTATGTTHTIQVTGSANFDPGYEVFTGSCGALTSIFCNASGGNSGLTLTDVIATIPTTQYWIRVYDYGIAYPASTTFTICILNPPPANDDCTGAIALTPLTSTCVAGSNQQTGDVSGATQSMVGCTGVANDDVWYTFTTTATPNQPYLITVSGAAPFNAVFEVFSGTCAALVSVPTSCTNATGAGGTETLTLTAGFQLAVSTTYRIRVYDANSGYPTNTNFTICVTIPPINDNCNGTSIGVYGNITTPAICGLTTAGTLTGATASGFAATCGGTPSADVFYTFTSTSTTHIITVTPTCGTMNPAIQVYSGSCGGTSISCTNAFGNGVAENAYLSGLTNATVYYVRVYDFNGVSACTSFNICVSTPPVNDPCASAINLTVSTSCVNTSGSILNGTQSFVSNCAGTTVSSDVWYRFTAASATQTITVTGAAGIDVVYELYSSSPCAGGGTYVGCRNLTGTGGSETNAWTGLTAGNVYWVRVYDASGGNTTSAFAICVVTPLNNTCANAIPVTCGVTYTGNSNIGIANAPASCTSNAGGNPGVWYVFTGTGQNVFASLCGSSYDTQIYVYSSTGPCTGLACVAGNDDSGGVCGLQSITTFGTTAGVNYYIFICGFSGQTGAFTMNLTCLTPPVNDMCAGAINVTCGIQGSTGSNTTAGSTAQASANGDITNCSGASGATAQYPTGVWYLFDGNVNGGSTVNVSLCGSSFNTMLGVWSATSCAGPFTCVAGNDDFCGTSSQVTFTAGVGTLYYIEVFGFYTQFYSGPATGSFTLNVQATGAGCQVLPIELVYFTAEAAGKRNLIKWSTATETNNDYFTIEKANDGVGWMTLGRVNGAGTSTQVIDYHTYDDEPYNNVTYYRLKQTDYNGAYTYSAIIAVNNSMNEVSVNNVHPNPTTDDIAFDFNSVAKGNVRVQILDYLGRVVSDEVQNVNDGVSVINSKMGNLSKGVYSLKVMFEQTGYISITKVVKN